MVLKVLHIITGLGVGGAESMLLKLIEASDHTKIEHSVVSLTSLGTVGPRVAELGIRVTPLCIKGGGGWMRGLLQARSIVKDFRPHLVQTWLHHADLFGVMLKLLVPGLRLVWNLRCADLPITEMPRRNRWLVRLLALLSRVPTLVVANAEAGRTAHATMGYAPRKWEIIPNGFNTKRFAPDPVARNATRRAWGVSDNDFVIGNVGRYHTMKGHALFIEMAGGFSLEYPNVTFVLAGRGIDKNNRRLMDSMEKAGVAHRFVLLGERSDITAVMNGFDLLANTSSSEGFPNVIGEAMACGVPCIATAAGDSALVIGETGRVVAIGDKEGLVLACRSLCSMSRDGFQALKDAARQRILDNYEIGAVAERYQGLYANIARAEARNLS